MKFGVRDIMWLTVVAAMLVAWALDHSRWLSATKQHNDYLIWKVETYESVLRSDGYTVDENSAGVIIAHERTSRTFGGGPPMSPPESEQRR
jgi:hypothetical protein